MNGCSITAEYFINHIPLGIGIGQAKAGSTWTLRMALASHEATGLRGEHKDFIGGTQPKKRILKKYSGKSLCNSTRFILKAPQYFPNWLAPHNMYHSLNEQDLLWMTLRDVGSSLASNYIFRKRYKNKTFNQFVMAWVQMMKWLRQCWRTEANQHGFKGNSVEILCSIWRNNASKLETIDRMANSKCKPLIKLQRWKNIFRQADRPIKPGPWGIDWVIPLIRYGILHGNRLLILPVQLDNMTKTDEDATFRSLYNHLHLSTSQSEYTPQDHESHRMLYPWLLDEDAEIFARNFVQYISPLKMIARPEYPVGARDFSAHVCGQLQPQ